MPTRGRAERTEAGEGWLRKAILRGVKEKNDETGLQPASDPTAEALPFHDGN